MTTILTDGHKALIAARAEDYLNRSESLDVQELARAIKVRASVVYNYLRRKKIDYKRRRVINGKTGGEFAPGCFNPHKLDGKPISNWVLG